MIIKIQSITITGRSTKEQHKKYKRSRKWKRPMMYAYPCSTCGELFTHENMRSKYCGRTCRYAVYGENRKAPCLGCGEVGQFTGRRDKEADGYCSTCRPRKDREADTLQAMCRAENYPRILQGIKDRTLENEGGCWIWQGATARGYGIYTILNGSERRQVSVHRLVMEAHLEREVVEHVHHKCAARACCNPEHLELATASENTLEMLSRTSFERRIAQLESEVADLKRQLAEVKHVTHER